MHGLLMVSLALFAAAHADKESSSFEGSYQVTSPGYVGIRYINIEHQPEGFYSVLAHFGSPDLSFKAKGLEAYGYLGILGGVDMPTIAVYQKQDSELSGLSTGYKCTEVYPETTSQARPLVLSDIDFTGTYRVTGNIGNRIDSTTSYEIVRDMDIPEISPFEYTMSIKTSGSVWDVEYTSQASDWGNGIGIAVGDVLVIGFIDNLEDTEIWILKRFGDTFQLEGRWLYCFKDRDDKQVVMNGWVNAVREEP